MADQIENWRVLQFNARVNHLLQQSRSKFRSAVMEGSHTGKQASVVDQVGPVELLERHGRATDLDLVDIELKRRWVAPTRFGARKILDDLDQLEVLLSPKSNFAEALRKGANRKIDQVINTAFLGAAMTGENGASTETFDTANQIVSGGSGMSVNKLRKLQELFYTNEVDLDEEEAYVAISPKCNNQLLSETQVNSKDYNVDRDGKPILVKGRINQFLGFNFIVTNRLTLSGTTRQCVAWVKSGMYLGMWSDIKTPIDWLPEKQSWQIAVTAFFGATRLENGRVIQIDCVEPA